jgi:D-sedoheptulose 7-phosphate isomerase
MTVTLAIVVKHLRDGAEIHRRLAEEQALIVLEAARMITESLAAGGRILLFGNGGSAATAQHIAAEFVGRFRRERQPLPAMALAGDTASVTAISNDFGFEDIFARQLQGLATRGDVAIAISASGNSPNVLKAVAVAREMGVTVIGFTGTPGGKLRTAVDLALVVPAEDVAYVQEGHLACFHALCDVIEIDLAPER